MSKNIMRSERCFLSLSPIHVGYYDPFSVYPLIQSQVEAGLPLTNLHWKYRLSTPPKTIQSLPVRFVEEVPKATQRQRAENVFCRIMFIKIDNIDIYRSQVRPLIKEWLRHTVKGSNIDWLLVSYVPSSIKENLSGLIKTSLFDKLKYDFDIDGKELAPLSIESSLKVRCFKIKETYENNADEKEAYSELISAMKDVIMETFTEKFHFYETRKSDNETYGIDTFKTEMELADILGSMRLLQESLNMYDDLTNKLDFLKEKKAHVFMKSLQGVVSRDFSNCNFEESIQSINAVALLSSDKINLLALKCYIFVKQSSLLQLLADTASTTSLSSLFITRLFQKLILLIADVSNAANKPVDEWVYFVCQTYLNLPACKMLSETQHQRETESKDVPQLIEFLEFNGELTLLCRNALKNLGERLGYMLGEYQEISLGDNENENMAPLTYEPLKNILKDKESYYLIFQKMTEEIIRNFIDAGRSKSVDLLSIDHALVNHNLGNHEAALKILHESYNFFIFSGWDIIGQRLLELYLELAEKIDSSGSQTLTVSFLDLLSNLTVLRNKSSNVALGHSSKKEKIAVNKLQQDTLKLNERVFYPLEKIFQADVIPFIFPDDTSEENRYCIRISLSASLDVPFGVSRILLELQLGPVTLSFLSDDCCAFEEGFKSTQKTFTLSSNKFYQGAFTPLNLVIEVNEKLHLIKSYEDTTAYNSFTSKSDKSVINYALLSENNIENDLEPKASEIYFYQSLSKLHCEVANPLAIDLNHSEFLVRVRNGSGTINDVKIDVLPISQHLLLKSKKSTSLEKITAKETVELKIPYNLYSDDNIIEVETSITYKSGTEYFTHVVKHKLDTRLTISVSVQDIFKSDCFFSKFQVGKSDPKQPIRILSNDLSTDNENYEIFKPRSTYDSLATYGDLSASFFYKIKPKNMSSIASNVFLDLEIRYSILGNECSNYVDKVLLQALDEHALKKYWYLLSTLLLPEIKYDLNSYVLSLTVKVLHGEDVLLSLERQVLPHIEEKAEKQNMVLIVENVVKANNKVSSNNLFEDRHLQIAVPLPTLNVMQIVDIGFERRPLYKVGEPIHLTINVESIKKWSLQYSNEKNKVFLAESSPGSEVATPDTDTFQLSVLNDDNWLVSGYRRQKFTVNYSTNENKNSFSFTFIPLTVGKVLFPKLNVRPLDSHNSDFTMDIDFKNGLESLLIVPDLNSITFSF